MRKSEDRRRLVESNYFNDNLPPPLVDHAMHIIDTCSGIPQFRQSGPFEPLTILFGFQSSSMLNQKEHLMLLISNALSRQQTVQDVHRKIFANYVRWCRFHSVTCVFPAGEDGYVTHMALFLMIWGEAANLRFMPECLCFLYHKAASRLEYILATTAADQGLEVHFQPESSYLYTIIQPIYNQAMLMKNSKLDHDQTRNYDDINEFFWSEECLEFSDSNVATALGMQHVKTFQEKRSLFNPLLAFYRIYFFLLLMFHVIIAIAYIAHKGGPSETSGFGFYENFFAEDTEDLRKHAIYSVQISFTFLSALKVILEVWIEGIRIYADKQYATSLLIRLIWHVVFFGLSIIIWLSPYESVAGTTFLALAPVVVSFYFIPVLAASIGNSCFQNTLRKSLLGKYMRGSQDYIGPQTTQPFHVFRKYAAFWIVVFISKFLFNLQLMIIPLIGPSVEIYQLERSTIENPPQGFLESNHNIFLLIALWTPVFLVYLYDTQIWFTILQAVVGMIRGFQLKVGQSNRVSSFVARLKDAPYNFDRSIVSRFARAMDTNETEQQKRTDAQSQLRFAVTWNECIGSFRLADLIDDREAMILRYTIEEDGSVQDPIFLLAGKNAQAIDIAVKTPHFLRQMQKKDLIPCVVSTFSLTYQMFSIILGKEDQGIIDALELFAQGATNLQSLIVLEKLPEIRDALVDFIAAMLDLPEPTSSATQLDTFNPLKSKLNESNNICHDHDAVLFVIQQAQQLFRTIEQALKDNHILELFRTSYFANITSELLYQKDCMLRLFNDARAMNISTRLFLLLTLDEADSLPRCNEAQRRISFFLHSLSMDMPTVASMESIQSFSVITPYYNEAVLYSLEELNAPVKSNPQFTAVEEENRGELTILKYLTTCHPDEWGNFLERLDSVSMEHALMTYPTEVRLWASNRGQTLARTVQGMMMYEDAIKMLRWLEVGSDQRLDHEAKLREMDNLVRLKFSYITSCQLYDQQRGTNDPRADDIDFLMKKYPNWRVAYTSERQDEMGNVRHDAVLAKSNGDEIVEVYRYELPGTPIIGEGKPENQNIALQFSRGEFVQTIDMNQEHYFEETLKMPNFLETASNQKRPVTIIGMKEHIFTANASSLARFMTLQELVFVSVTQRVLADPLQARMHYGHPDTFDKLYIMTNGGVSKASKGINLSEDVFGGYNITLRGGRVTHHEFMLCGKGRDVSLNQISAFEAKLANGSAESSLSREAHRLGQHLDFFRLHSLYYGHMGFYIANFLTVACVFAYTYSKVYVALHTATEFGLISNTATLNQLATVLNTQFIFQIGLLMTVPLLATLLTENSIRVGLAKFVEVIVTLGPIFYVFETGTKAHYFDIALLRGGSKYRSTGRGFLITREMFVNFFKEYAVSHYRKAVELVALLIIFGIYGNFNVGTGALDDWCSKVDCDSGNIPLNITLLESYSSQGQSYGVASFAVWLLAVTWLLAPFFFNTNGLDFAKTKVDVKQWVAWMFAHPDQGQNYLLEGRVEDGWISWWLEEMKGRAPLTRVGRAAILLREFRHFFIMTYIFLVDFDYADMVWLAAGIGLLMFLVTTVDFAGRCGQKFLSPTFRGSLYLMTLLGIFISLGVILYIVDSSSTSDAIRDTASLLIGIFAGTYGILQYTLAFNGVFDVLEWTLVQNLAFLFDTMFGAVIVIPLLLLSAAPFMSIIQTRMMYNGGFSKALSTSGEFAASISVLVGVVGGFIYGWLTCAIFSLGFINDPEDGFQNTSFVFFVNNVLGSYDREAVNVYAGLASVVAIFICGIILHCLGRRASLLIASIATVGGLVLVFINTGILITIGICLMAAGIAALALSCVMYGYEITTQEWKGKSVLIFLLGAALGFLIEANLLHSMNADTLATNWANEPETTWRYQLLYGSIPLIVLIPVVFWIPESPVWLYQRSMKSAEHVLIRLRQKHDVIDELETLRYSYTRGGSFCSVQLPRVALIFTMQAAYAVSSSNTLLYRYIIKAGEDDFTGGPASRWQAYYGIVTFIGLIIGSFIIDQIRRKTILKDILPFVATIATICGILNLLSVSDAWIELCLFLLFFAVALSLGAVTWLTSMELFSSRYQRVFTPASFAVFYIVETIIFVLRPSFAASQFIFAGLTMILGIVLLLFCASTKGGAIRLKSEKRKEKETDSQEGEPHARGSSHSRSHLRAFSNRSSRSNATSFLMNQIGGLPITPEVTPVSAYDQLVTPKAIETKKLV